MRETAKDVLARRRIERGTRALPFITVAEFGLRLDDNPPVLFVRGTGLPPTHGTPLPCPFIHGRGDRT